MRLICRCKFFLAANRGLVLIKDWKNDGAEGEFRTLIVGFAVCPARHHFVPPIFHTRVSMTLSLGCDFVLFAGTVCCSQCNTFCIVVEEACMFDLDPRKHKKK